MNHSPDDEIRFDIDAYRALRDVIGARLLERGWAVTDPIVSDDESLEWFWPPTAPAGYGGQRSPFGEAERRYPQFYRPPRTPWILPTRFSQDGEHWTLRYGSAIGQEPEAASMFVNMEDLVADLERIECWPMSVEEFRRLRADRIVVVASALARDEHFLAFDITEPYTSRLASISEHRRFDTPRQHLLLEPDQPESTRVRGDLTAQYLLVDGDAWASSVRTTRAGGVAWKPDGDDAS